MKEHELRSTINKISKAYKEISKSHSNISRTYIGEEIKKLAYEFIIDYAILNGLVLKGFDYKRYKSDNSYIWYHELLEVLEFHESLTKEERDKNISSELSYLIHYTQYEFRNVEF
jgi:hypothetical protein